LKFDPVFTETEHKIWKELRDELV